MRMSDVCLNMRMKTCGSILGDAAQVFYVS